MEPHRKELQADDHTRAPTAEWYFPSYSEIEIPTFCEDACSNDVLYDVYKMPTANLSVPLDAVYEEGSLARHRRLIHSPSLQLDGIRYGANKGRIDPYSPTCMVPLPDHFGEPCFIRRRNERERERVRCVNEGYTRLKDHLPFDGKDRRMSKVETLRGAIKYIRQLQRLLDNDSNNNNNNNNNINTNNSKSAHSDKRIDTKVAHFKKITSSFSSSDPDSPDSFT